MSTAVKKPPPPGAAGRANSTPSTPGAAGRNSPRSSTPNSAATNGVNRNRSVRTSSGTPVSARAAVKRPGAVSSLSSSSTSAAADDTDDDVRAETAALIQELKDRLQKAETVSEEYQKQVEVLQSRLDDALHEQAKLEERVHEEEERVEALQNEQKEMVRRHRELEGIYEAERAGSMKEKEEAQAREDELHDIIQRLKETLAQRDLRPGSDEEGRMSRTSSFRSNTRSNSAQNLETGQFAPPAQIQRSNSRNNSKLLLQKDKVIESLRLELAEAQIKLVEMENMGGGRVQELERILLETRMTNARLMEDNESFQLLLSEKTLNGDFSRGEFMRGTTPALEDRIPSRSGPSTSLADELESAEDSDDQDSRKLEAEVNYLKEQNKALTLYINKIIERLLQHQGFESILDADAPKANTDKELPPPPPPKEEPAQSFLQRTKSVVVGSTRTRPRPMSMAPPPAPSSNVESITSNPDTAPSIPLGRSQSVRMSSGNYTHRRSTSEWSSAATVVSNMYRGPVPAPSSGPTSPGIVSPRSSFFGVPVNPSSRVPSAASNGPRASVDENRVPPVNGTMEGVSTSDAGGVNIDTPSPPRSTASSFDRAGGSVMAGNKMRPLRLVQETAEAEAEATARNKAANRGSWIAGWFNKGGERPVSDGSAQ